MPPKNNRNNKDKEKQFASDNIMSNGMLPTISADELINEQVKFMGKKYNQQEAKNDK
ncbi:MAG: hypothetical protein ACOX3A_10110 [bacterium]